jgi:ABC-type polysaccharide/polyol phosphate export permease
MKFFRLADKAAVILRRDCLTVIRYRSSFVMGIGAAAAELAAFYFLARSVGPGFRPEGMGYFPFLLVGTGFYTFLMMGIHAFLASVQEAQQTGTLEVLMTTATPAPTLLFLSAISAFARNTARLGLYLLAGFLLLSGNNFARPNIGAALLVLIFSFTIAMAIGILAAAIQLTMQKGSAVMWLFGSMAWFMTGTLFPVSSLPKPLVILANLIPITHCLNALRLALFQSADVAGLMREISVLAWFAIVLLPSSLVIFSYTLSRARLEGTLSFY